MANTTLVNVDELTAPKLVSFISSMIIDDEESGKEESGKGADMLELGNNLIDGKETKGLIELILKHSDKIISADQESGTYLHNI